MSCACSAEGIRRLHLTGHDMNLLVNATSVGTGVLTGIERFGLRIAQELCRIDPATRIVGMQDIPGIPHVTRSRLLDFGKLLLGRKEYLLRAVWDQTVFRHQAIKSKADVVFFPIQDGMLRPPMPQIVTVHDLHYRHFDRSIAECKDEISGLRKAIYRVRMPQILSNSAAVVAVSEATKRDLVDSFDLSPDKVHVVYNGYDEERFRVVDEPDGVLQRYGLIGRRYFLFVGSILRHKNLDRLVQALGQLDGEICLVVAGVCKDVSYFHQVKETVRSLGMSPERIRFQAYVPDQDLPSLYSGALALVLPSLHEGFGVPLVEAMACGTPVITSNTSAMPEVAGDAAFYVEPGSVESITGGMREIAADSGLRDRLRMRGFERAKMFRWSTSARRLYTLCRSVCDQ